VLIGIFTAVILLQFIQPYRNDKGDKNHAEFKKAVSLPENIGQILNASCFDCHSNSTTYPWYTYVQPIGWSMNSHIEKGKSELNFDEFDTYPLRRKLSKLKSIAERIEDGSMPLRSYALIHRNAKLSFNEQKLITNWISEKLDSLKKNK
jgi:hypothetical protein